MTNGTSYWRLRTSRRRLLGSAAVAGLSVGAGALVGCGGSKSEGPATTGSTPAAEKLQARRGGTVVYSQGNYSEILDPHKHIGQSVFLWSLIADLAVETDGPSWSLQPSLVEKWEVPGDATQLLMHVRQGVKWHNREPTNGRPLTADDIAFNIMRMSGKLDPANAGQYQRASNFINMNRAEPVDNKTAKITMDKPSSIFFNGLADYRNSIIAKEQVEKGLGDPSRFVGTGAFTIEKWANNGQQSEFKRNPEYWRKQGSESIPYLDGVQWNYLADQSAQLAAFVSKQIDWFGAGTPTIRQTVGSAYKDAVLYNWPYATWNGFRFNVTEKPFDDPRVRQAIQLALDYKPIGDGYFGQGFWEYTGPLAAAFPEAIPSSEIAKMAGWNPNTKQQDIQRAKDLLRAAGFPDGFSWKLMTFPTTTTYFYENAVRGKDQLEKIWPAMKIDLDLPGDVPAFSRRLGQGDFAVVSYGQFPFPAGTQEMVTNYHTKGTRNYGKFSDSGIDQRLDAALVEIDEKKRAALLKDAQQQMIINLTPQVMLHQFRQTMFSSPRVKGFADLVGPGSFGGYDISIFANRYWLAS